jgi:hypothetical protein
MMIMILRTAQNVRGGGKLSRALTAEKSFAFNADYEFLINYKLKAV